MATFDPTRWYVTGTTTSSTDNWSIVTSNSTNWYQGAIGVTGVGFVKSTTTIQRIAERALKWAKEFIKESPNYTDLNGFCGLASRYLHKQLKNEGIKSKLAYLKSPSYQHVFVIVPKNDQWGVNLAETHLLDITAAIFGEDEISLMPYKDIDILEKPWWSYDDLYESDSGLMARQRRDGWSITQISLTEAKRKQASIGLVQVGRTNIEAGIIKIQPFDQDAIKFFKGQAKGSGLKANLAQLILDKDPDIADAALKIATEILSR